MDSFAEDQKKVAGKVLKRLRHCNHIGSMTSFWIQKSNQVEYLTKRKSSCVCRCWLISHRAFSGQSMAKERRGGQRELQPHVLWRME